MEGLALGVGLDELVGELGVDVGELVDLGPREPSSSRSLARKKAVRASLLSST